MRNSIEPKDKLYLKEYGSLSFAKNMDKHLSNKYSQKLLESAKKSTPYAIKTTSKKKKKKTAEAIGDLIGNKIADKVINVAKSQKSYTSKIVMLIMK